MPQPLSDTTKDFDPSPKKSPIATLDPFNAQVIPNIGVLVSPFGPPKYIDCCSSYPAVSTSVYPSLFTSPDVMPCSAIPLGKTTLLNDVPLLSSSIGLPLIFVSV